MALKYRRNPFNTEKVYAALETLARQQDRSSAELGAIHLSSDAVLFIFAPPASFVSEEGRVMASVNEILVDRERGHAYVAALAPWVEEVKRHATEEQRQFLREIGLDGVEEKDAESARSIGDEEDEAPPVHDIETRPFTKILPEPAHAVSILEALVERYDPRTEGHTCLELAVQTLRFLLDTDQVDAFCAFLDELEKPRTRSRDGSSRWGSRTSGCTSAGCERPISAAVTRASCSA